MKDKDKASSHPTFFQTPEGFTSFTSGGLVDKNPLIGGQIGGQNQGLVDRFLPKKEDIGGQESLWVSIEKLAELSEKTYQTCKKEFQRGKYTLIKYIESKGGSSGRRPLIHITDPGISGHAQARWIKENIEIAKVLPVEILKQFHPEARQALARLIAQEKPSKEEYHMVEGEDIQELDKKAYAVREYLLDPRYKTAERLSKELGVNPSTIYRWVEAAKQGQHRATFMLQDTPIPIKLPRTKVPEDIFLESLNIILAHQKARISQGYEYLKQKGYELSYSQYTRILKEMNPSFEKILRYHRSGRIAALLSETPKIIRAWTKLPAMHTIVGDQHYMDYYFFSEELNDIVKFTLYIWMDCSSRYYCSCIPAAGNYTQWHVQASLIEAFRIHTPSEIYTDWGKQENAKATEELIKRLDGGYLHIGDFDEFTDRYPDSRISRKRSTPGVPPVKPIESAIKRLTEALNQRGLPGYMRRDMQDPFRSKRIQDELRELARKGGLLTVEQGMEALIDVIRELNNSPIKTEEGKTFVPAEFLWSGLEGRRVVWSEEDLAMLLFPRYIRTVNNGQVRVTVGDKTVYFHAKELTWCRTGEKVCIFVNPFPPHEGSIIFRQKGEEWEYFCHAEAWEGYRVDPRDAETLRRAMEVKYSYLRQFVLALREIHKYKPEGSVIRIGEVTKFTQEVKKTAEVKTFPEIKKKDDWAKKNWQALGKLAEKFGY